MKLPEFVLAIDGFMSEEELEWLYDTAMKMKSIVEIGVWKGRSTAALGAGCFGPVFGIDHFWGSPSERTTNHREAAEKDLFAEASLNLAQLENVRILRTHSLGALKLFADGSVDMVFIDGDHDFDAVCADIVAWKPKVKKLLAGHDRELVGIAKALERNTLIPTPGPGSIWFVEFTEESHG